MGEYENAVNGGTDRIIKNLKKINDLINQDMIAEIKKDAEEIYNNAIEDFYNDYTPRKYKRRANLQTQSGGLFDMLQIEKDKEGVYRMEYDSSLIQFDATREAHIRDDEGFREYLYTLLFEEGWHGGAKSGKSHPNPGTPYYRRGPGYVLWGEEARRMGGGRNPYDIIEEAIKEINATKYNAIWAQLFSKYSYHIND